MAVHDRTTGAKGRAPQRRRALVIAVVALLVVGAAAGVLAGRAGLFGARAAAELPGARMADQGNRHIPTADAPHEPYNSDPPTSGPHLGYIAPWGVHTRPIPRELQVHNLEDGGVLVQYNCDCPDVAEKLGAIVRKYDKFVILAPYPFMKTRIAVTAWTRIDTMDEVDAARITRFIEAYRGVDHHPAR